MGKASVRTVIEPGADSGKLARDATLISVGLAMAGSGLGVFAIAERLATGAEAVVVLSSGVFGLAAFVALYFRKITVKTLAAVATAYYALYLCSGAIATVLGRGPHVNLFSYLVWFFPLLVFNKLVNSGRVGQVMDRFLSAAPLTLVVALSFRLIGVFRIDSLVVLAGGLLSYSCFTLALNAATRYRETYIMERERAESLRVEAALLEASAAKTRHLAFYDFLTNLPNRVLLRERMEEALTKSSHAETACALMLIDLDDFKTLNDTAGHDIGDVLLRNIARRIVGCVRKADTAARFGGDEFVVLLEGLSGDLETAVAEAKAIGEKILLACRQPIHLDNYDYEGTTSIGVTIFRGSQYAADQLLKQADLAMYRAKSRGRNAVCFFDTAMEALVIARATLLGDLKRAIQNGEFELQYQPQLDTVGRVTGAEALLRWRHPVRGLVPPAEFIPLAESAGLISSVGHWVLQTACQQLAAWAQRPEMEGLSVAVNVSIRQFQDSGFVASIRQLIAESGVNPRSLKLEITESFMMERGSETIAKMNALKALGLGFSMDDFGTGYSSLSQLKKLPLDQLKIDQSFMHDLFDGEKEASIVCTIIALAKSLNLSLIAEGVETEQQREFLEAQGCKVYQGYLFSPALPAARFELYVDSHRPTAERAPERRDEEDFQPAPEPCQLMSAAAAAHCVQALQRSWAKGSKNGTPSRKLKAGCGVTG